MKLIELIRPEYKETFPEALLPALYRYVDELVTGMQAYYDSEIFEDDYNIWMDYDLTLHQEILEQLPSDLSELSDEEAFEQYGECEVLSYRMIRWLRANVARYENLPIKLLSIFDLRLLPKPSCVVVKVNEDGESLDVSIHQGILEEEERKAYLPEQEVPRLEGYGYFTWPEELLPLYQ